MYDDKYDGYYRYRRPRSAWIWLVFGLLFLMVFGSPHHFGVLSCLTFPIFLGVVVYLSYHGLKFFSRWLKMPPAYGHYGDFRDYGEKRKNEDLYRDLFEDDYPQKPKRKNSDDSEIYYV